VDKDNFKAQIKSALLSLDVNEDAEDYSIQFNADTVLHFTQTHIAEVQEILRLLDEFGTPSDYADELYDENVKGPLLHSSSEGNNKKNIEERIESTSNIGVTQNNNTYTRTEKQTVSSSTAGVAREGSYVSYKRLNAEGEIKENTLKPERYALHKAFIGHKPGDRVTFMGWNYEILSVEN
jgi:hypothetical protein